MTILVGVLVAVFGVLLIVFRNSIPKMIYALLVVMYGQERAELFSNPRIDPWVCVFFGCFSLLLGAVVILSEM